MCQSQRQTHGFGGVSSRLGMQYALLSTMTLVNLLYLLVTLVGVNVVLLLVIATFLVIGLARK